MRKSVLGRVNFSGYFSQSLRSSESTFVSEVLKSTCVLYFNRRGLYVKTANYIIPLAK